MENILDAMDMLDRKLNAYDNAWKNLPLILEVLNINGQYRIADILITAFNQIETNYVKDTNLYNKLHQEVRI